MVQNINNILEGYGGIGTQPVGPGSTAQQCGTDLISGVSNIGDQSKDFYDSLNNAIGGKVLNNLATYVGGNQALEKLATSTSRLMDTKGETIDKIRRASLYKEWLTASKDLDTARAKVIATARHDSQTTDFQNNYMHPDISANIEQVYGNVTAYLIDVSTNFFIINDIFNDATDNFSIISNLIEMKEKTLFDTIGNIQLYEKKNNIDVRKNLYDFERNSFYNSIFDILKIVYYALFVIYIIFGNFMKLQLYKNPYFYVGAILYLLLPFALKYIFATIIYIYESVMRLLGQHETIYTYGDIVRASNIENIYTGPIPSILDRNNIEDGYRLFVENPINSSQVFI